MNKVVKYKLKLKMPRILNDECNYLNKRICSTPQSRYIYYELGDPGNIWCGRNQYITDFTMDEIREILTEEEIKLFELIEISEYLRRKNK